jgi:hypothetical protein
MASLGRIRQRYGRARPDLLSNLAQMWVPVKGANWQGADIALPHSCYHTAMPTVRRDPKGRIVKADEVPSFMRGRPRVVIRFAEVDGRLECVNVEIGARFDIANERADVITASTLREINLGSVIDKARRLAASHWHYMGRETRFTDGRAIPKQKLRAIRAEVRKRLPAATAKGKRRGGRRPLPVEHLVDVAETYLAAWENGESPTKAVGAWGHVSDSTAAKWVSRARQAGFLEKTTKGKAGPGRRTERFAWTESGQTRIVKQPPQKKAPPKKRQGRGKS